MNHRGSALDEPDDIDRPAVAGPSRPCARWWIRTAQSFTVPSGPGSGPLW